MFCSLNAETMNCLRQHNKPVEELNPSLPDARVNSSYYWSKLESSSQLGVVSILMMGRGPLAYLTIGSLFTRSLNESNMVSFTGFTPKRNVKIFKTLKLSVRPDSDFHHPERYHFGTMP